jgi:hypothetical protein
MRLTIDNINYYVNKEIFHLNSEKRVSGGTLTYETLLSGVLAEFRYSLYSAYYTLIIRRIRDVKCYKESSYRRLFSRRLAFLEISIFVFGTGRAERQSSFCLAILPMILRTRFRFLENVPWHAWVLENRFFCFTHGFVRNRPASIFKSSRLNTQQIFFVFEKHAKMLI